MPGDARKLECMICGAAQTVRTRAGKHWTCKKCGETNPGPAMMRGIFKGLARIFVAEEEAAAPPRRAARPAAKSEPPSSPAAVKVKIGRAPTSAPAAAKGEPAKPPSGKTPPTPQGGAKRSILGSLMHG